MNRQYESMTRLETVLFVVRVWRTEPSLAVLNNLDLKTLIASEEMQSARTPQDIIKSVEQLDRIGAVEVLDKGTGCGLLLYPDWH